MATKKILITGGAGMLATDLAAYLNRVSDHAPILLPRIELDITQLPQIEDIFTAYKPDVVINTAAVMVDPCEASPHKAYEVNAWAARNLARVCQRNGSALVQISTCGLFGDEIRPYHEYDSVQLKTVYARSKYAGEVHASEFCERYFNLRLGWLYGGTIEHRKNFVLARYQEAKKTDVMYSASDKYGSPTYSGDVAKTIVSLLESQEYGTYHLANIGDAATRADYVRYIVDEFGLGTVVEEVDSSHFPRQADVPNCEWLESFNLGYAGIPLLPIWQDALARYIFTLKKDLDLSSA